MHKFNEYRAIGRRWSRGVYDSGGRGGFLTSR